VNTSENQRKSQFRARLEWLDYSTALRNNGDRLSQSGNWFECGRRLDVTLR